VASQLTLQCYPAGRTLLVRETPPDPGQQAFAIGLAADIEHTLVILDLDRDYPAAAWELVLRDLSRLPGSLRLVPWRSRPGGLLKIGQWLADQLGRTVLAQDGQPVAAARGGLFVPPGTGSGWYRLGPGRQPGQDSRRFPKPRWSAVAPFEHPVALSQEATLQPLPAGVWLYGDEGAAGASADAAREHGLWLCAHMAWSDDTIGVVLGYPGGPPILASDVTRLWSMLPNEARQRVRFVRYGTAVPTGQELADTLGHRVVVHTGVPVGGWRAADPVRVVTVDGDGSPGWEPFASEVSYLPGGKAPYPATAVLPARLAKLPELSPCVFALAPGVVLEVVTSGLWLRPEEEPPDAAAVRRSLADRRRPAVWVDSALPGSPEAAMVTVLDALGPELRARCQVRPVTTTGTAAAPAAAPAAPPAAASAGAAAADTAAAGAAAADAAAADAAVPSVPSVPSVPAVAGASVGAAPTAAAATFMVPLVGGPAPDADAAAPTAAGATAEQPPPSPPAVAPEPRLETADPQIDTEPSEMFEIRLESGPSGETAGPVTPEGSELAPMRALATEATESAGEREQPVVRDNDLVAGPQVTETLAPETPATALPPTGAPVADALVADGPAGDAPAVDGPQALVQPIPRPAASAVPPERGIDKERQWFQRSFTREYGATASLVARVLSQSPGLRSGAGNQDVLTDLVAVRLYLTEHGQGIDDSVRTAKVGPHVPFARCVASGLRRLPSYRGAARLRATLADAEWKWYGSRRLVTEWAFCPALTDGGVPLTGTVDFLIWSVTARRTSLLAPEVASQVLFLPGTSFKVLRVRDGEQREVLLRELAAGEIGPDGQVETGQVPLDEVALSGLDKASDAWSRAPKGEELPERYSRRFGGAPGLILGEAEPVPFAGAAQTAGGGAE
jgi:hypothetical protein